MVKKIRIFICLLLAAVCFIFASCSGKGEPDGESGADDEVIVGQGIYDSEKRRAIEVWVRNNGIEVDIKSYLFAESFPQFTVNVTMWHDDEQYEEALADAFANGGLPDLFDTPRGKVYNDSYHVKQLADFYELIRGDSFFDHENYRMNVLRAFAGPEGLHSFPLYFNIRTAVINRDAPKHIRDMYASKDALNFLDFYDIFAFLPNEETFLPAYPMRDSYWEMSAENYFFGGFNYFFEYIFEVEDIHGIDAEHPIVGSFLKYLGNTLFASFTYNNRYGSPYRSDSENASHINLLIGSAYATHFHFALEAEDRTKPFYTDMKPFTDMAGNILLIPEQVFCIPSGSMEKELAWEFLKYLAQTESLFEYDYTKQSLPVYIPRTAAFVSSIVSWIKNSRSYDGLGYALKGSAETQTAAAMDFLSVFDSFHMMRADPFFLHTKNNPPFAENFLAIIFDDYYNRGIMPDTEKVVGALRQRSGE